MQHYCPCDAQTLKYYLISIVEIPSFLHKSRKTPDNGRPSPRSNLLTSAALSFCANSCAVDDFLDKPSTSSLESEWQLEALDTDTMDSFRFLLKEPEKGSGELLFSSNGIFEARVIDIIYVFRVAFRTSLATDRLSFGL
jgi:hypothetical protein